MRRFSSSVILPLKKDVSRLIESRADLTRPKSRGTLSQFLKTVENFQNAELIEMSQFIASQPNTPSHHSTFTQIARHILTRSLTPSESVAAISALITASLHIVSRDTRRYRGQQANEALEAEEEAVRRLVSNIFDNLNQLNGIEKSYFLFLLAIAIQREYPNLPDCSIETLNRIATDSAPVAVEDRMRLVWALGVLEPSLGDKDHIRMRIRRLIGERDIAQCPSIRELVMLESGMQSLNMTGFTLYPRLKTSLDSLSQNPNNTSGRAAADALWWQASSESPVHPLLPSWLRTCVSRLDSLSSQDKWKAKTAMEHLVESARQSTARGSESGSRTRLAILRSSSFTALSAIDRNQILFCVENDVLSRPDSRSISYRRGQPFVNK
jgi:hypothetical protein